VIPTAPVQRVTLLGGNITTSWFDVTELNGKNAVYDAEGLEASTAYISSLVEVTHVCVCVCVCVHAYACQAVNVALCMYPR
jgi:hypothetical protein